MSARKVLVFGYGPGFERSFGRALERAGLSLVKARQGHEVNSGALLVCWLDGEPICLPEPSDSRLASACVWISDSPLPEGFPQPAVTLDEKVPAETMLFHLGPMVHGGEQRRKEERHLAFFDVLCRTRSAEGSGQELRSQLTNLSLGGAFVRALDPLPEGQRVELEIEIDSNLPPLVLTGRVVHRVLVDRAAGALRRPGHEDAVVPAHPGFAVAFDVGSFETRSMLSRLLRGYSPR